MDDAQPRRGPGRPPGSLNRPKLSDAERQELTRRLSAEHAEAIAAHALAKQRLKGIKALARVKLGAAGLHEIEAALSAPAANAVLDMTRTGSEAPSLDCREQRLPGSLPACPNKGIEA